MSVKQCQYHIYCRKHHCMSVSPVITISNITAVKYDEIETTEGITLMLAKAKKSTLPLHVKLNCLVVSCLLFSFLTLEKQKVHKSSWVNFNQPWLIPSIRLTYRYVRTWIKLEQGLDYFCLFIQINFKTNWNHGFDFFINSFKIPQN